MGTRTLACIFLTIVLALLATQAIAQTIHGTATYRERMALPPGAVLEATIQDVSRADVPATVVASTRVESPGNPPIAFTIAYDQAKILPDHRYVVRVRILFDGKLLFTSDVATPVITRGNPTSVSMMLRRVGAGQKASASPGSPTSPSARPLEATYWRAIDLAGKPTPTQDVKREAHLVFEAGGRVSGSDGCNRITGGYELKGDGITFGQMAGTQMACPDTADIELGVRAALTGASRWMIVGDRLELFDGTGARLAAFEARPPTPRAATSPALQGTAWRLVRFQGSDDTTLTPDDKAKYTIEFGVGGRLTARIDCNQGRGTWKSSASSQLEFGPLALTRAKCPDGSLHDRIVKHWTYIRSYIISRWPSFPGLDGRRWHLRVRTVRTVQAVGFPPTPGEGEP